MAVIDTQPLRTGSHYQMLLPEPQEAIGLFGSYHIGPQNLAYDLRHL